MLQTATESIGVTLSAYGLSPRVSPGVFLKNNVVHIQIDFYGDKDALLIIEMCKEQACFLVSAMMKSMGMDMPITELDDMTKSALGEICNQICGGVCTSISNIGIIMDIKPPQVDIREEGLNPKRAIGYDLGNGFNAINVYFIIR